MKRSSAFPPNYLSQDDVAQPIVATIADVHPEALIDQDTGATKTKPVMTFAPDNIRPLILNQVNWSTIEAAYGEDSDSWIGKPIELYRDPNIMCGKRRVGGIRVRIPAQQTTHARPAPATQAARPHPKEEERSASESLKLVLEAYARQGTIERIEEWHAWYLDTPNTTKEMDDQESDAYHAAVKAQASRGTPPRRQPASA